MKKVLLFMMLSVLTSSVLVSCSKDDKPDPIVGKWYFRTINGIKVGDCAEKSNFNIMENYTFELRFSNKDTNEKGDCELNTPFRGKWEKKKQGKYIFFIKDSEDKNRENVLLLRNNDTELVTHIGDRKLVCKKK